MATIGFRCVTHCIVQNSYEHCASVITGSSVFYSKCVKPRHRGVSSGYISSTVVGVDEAMTAAK